MSFRRRSRGRKPNAKRDKPAESTKVKKQTKERKEDKQKTAQPPTEKVAKPRRFPFRKLADLEDEIFARETYVKELEKDLILPEVLRDGDRVRKIMAQMEEERAAIKTLYEHWEEASERNW